MRQEDIDLLKRFNPERCIVLADGLVISMNEQMTDGIMTHTGIEQVCNFTLGYPWETVGAGEIVPTIEGWLDLETMDTLHVEVGVLDVEQYRIDHFNDCLRHSLPSQYPVPLRTLPHPGDGWLVQFFVKPESAGDLVPIFYVIDEAPGFVGMVSQIKGQKPLALPEWVK